VSERYFSGHMGEAGALGQSGARDAKILIQNFNLPQISIFLLDYQFDKMREKP
jgi:hypothetical protein